MTDNYRIELYGNEVCVVKWSYLNGWQFSDHPRWWLPWQRSLAEAVRKAEAYIERCRAVDAQFEANKDAIREQLETERTVDSFLHSLSE